jgi:hypothetical protein
MRKTVGNILKAISLVLLLLCGAVFGEGALERGSLPLIALAIIPLIGLPFWIGDKLNPM